MIEYKKGIKDFFILLGKGKENYFDILGWIFFYCVGGCMLIVYREIFIVLGV